MTLKTRLLASLVVVAIFPLSIASALLFQNSVNTIRQQQKENASRLLESQGGSLDRMMRTAYQNLIQLLSTPDLVAVLSSITNNDGSWTLFNRLDSTSNALNTMQSMNNDLFEVIGIYSGEAGRTVLQSYDLSDKNPSLFYGQVMEKAGKPVWIVLENEKGGMDVYIAGAVLRPHNNEVIGAVYIKIRYRYLLALLMDYSGQPDEHMLLFGDGKLIAAAGDGLPPLSGQSFQTGEAITVEIDGKSYLSVSRDSYVTGWTMVYLINSNRITQAVFTGAGYIMLIAVMAMGASIFLAAGLSYSAYRPVKELTELISSIDRDSLKVRAPEHFSGDLGVISNSVNTMLNRIQDLISEVEQEKEAKLNAEMAALRAQINPHFLYNTLNVIKYLAGSGQNGQAEKVCVCLIRLLRTSIGNSKECITLAEELTYVENYAEIMRFRVDKSFMINYETRQDARNLLIPKFTLQPIVENCIIHGFLNETDGNEIFITSVRDGEVLRICVADNGQGMERNKVLQLEEVLNTRQGLLFSKVGILNVNERIQHVFGEGFGLTVESEAEEGTRIRIHIPAIEQTE